MAERDDDPRLRQTRDKRQRNGGRRERDHHRPRARRDQRLGVGLAHRPDPLRRMDALAARIDERALDMNPERAGHERAGLACGGQRGSEHRGGVGDDGRQEAGDALAPVRAGDRSDPLDGRLGVEQHAPAAVDLPVDQAGREDPAAAVDLIAAARPLLDVDEGANDAVFDDERVVVEEPLAVEQARAEEHGHREASFPVETTPPAINMAPSVASCRGRVRSAAISGAK